MSQNLGGKKPQNIFLIADHLQKTYKKFVETFQEFKNPVIQEWVDQKMEKEDLLYKDPLIELNFQFEKGKSLEKFVNGEILNQKIPNIFSINPYTHQSEAIEKICRKNKNIIVSTGTGSGKSECFWIPIVNTCLEMKSQGLGGIKAIVIFPMNALANSQYNRMARQLNNTGLTIGRYTGDTAYSPSDARRELMKNQGREPYDCELLSREEIRESPPDILITNYVMLDLILTRFEDKKLFPERFKGYLKYLVLDEIHTYSGNSGADVAGLIRRLKEKTKTHGKIRCIGTSATIQDNKKSGETASIIEFAEKIFGEPFDSDSLIEATYVDMEISESDKLNLPATIEITDEDLINFDGTFSSIIPLAEKLLGRSLRSDERTPEGLGKTFHYHPTIIFLRNALKKEAKALNTLAEKYRYKFRKGESLEDCLRELKAAFLLGTIGLITIQKEKRPLLVPKLHIFFTRGQELYACLTHKAFNEKDPHLNIDGEILCKECEKPSFPLYFCRICGQEFYSVLISEEGEVSPRTFNMEEKEGELNYLVPKTSDNDSWEIPGNWLKENGKIKKTYKNAPPDLVEYCPDCNKINPSCDCSNKIEVWKIPYPLQLCPSCNIYYTKRKGEYGKLFSFNSAGRSSSTDILTIETLSDLNKDQKKQIIFTDSRQDTALQAEHLNEFRRRVHFRQIFYHTLKNISEKDKRVSDKEIGEEIYRFLNENGIMPEYQKEKKEEDEFTTAPEPEREFKEYLAFLALSDIMESNYFLDLNLEKLGVLKIEYDGLEDLANHQYITELPTFKSKSFEERYDFLRGILDLFRWKGAIANPAFIDTVNKYEDWEEKFNEDILFDINKSHYNRVGFAFETPKGERKVYHNRQRIIFKSISWYTTMLISWTKKFFGIEDYEKADAILEKIIKILDKRGFLDTFWTKRPSFELYQIKAGKLLFKVNENSTYLRCPKCHRTYFFKDYHNCSRRNCPELESEPIENDHFYLDLYKKLPKRESEVHAKEHSAQVEGAKRESFERDFQDNEIGTTNVLVCTPTMELGIDIGELSAILMRNVPPDPSRYAQRAGRAGRKNQPSIVSVFCGTGMAKGPHDQYFYNQPEKIVSGKITPPNFLLDNKKLLKKHINAAIIETLSLRFSQNMREILDLEKRKENLPFHESVEIEIVNSIQQNKEILNKTINNIFKKEIDKYSWFTQEFIDLSINTFFSEFDNVLDNFRERYFEVLKEMKYFYNKSIGGQGLDKKDQREQKALQMRIYEMQNGEQPYDTFSLLRNYGFLPNYGFPSDNTLLTMYDQKKPAYHDNWRSTVIAIREFAPYNQIYFLGSKYNVNRAFVKSDKGEIHVDNIYICEHCNEILIDSKTQNSKSLTKCPNCEEEIKLSNYKSSIHFPHMHSINRSRITCDEENRQVKGYEITMNYNHKESELEFYKIECDSKIMGTITYQHNGQIFMVNKGTNVKSKTTNKVDLKPFSFCSACGLWLPESKVNEHIDKCSKNASERNIYQNLWLFIEGNHDVVVFNLPHVGDTDKESYYITLKETIFQSLILTYNLDESELQTFINPRPGEKGDSIVVFETEEGGTGILKSLLDTSTVQFEEFTENMLRILHHKTEKPYDETIEACVSACYNCLLRFRNQYEHDFLDRKLVIPLLKKLMDCHLKENNKKGGKNERSNNIEELIARCDSNLEKKVLEKIQDLELPLPKEAQKTYYEGDVPISTADFYYEINRNKIYVFVDGPPHTPDNVQETDQEKRIILESKGYSVVKLDFKDGKYQKDPSLIAFEINQKLRPYIVS